MSNDYYPVRLDTSEIMQGAQIGLMRVVWTLKNPDWQCKHGQAKKKLWNDMIEGALGELAVAKFLGLYHSAGKGGHDVIDFEVRTRASHNYDLMLHKTDKPAAEYVLVSGMFGDYAVRGWILGGDGMQEKYWSERGEAGRPAYFVPQSALQPMAEFRYPILEVNRQ